jgi:hypothetical protein
MGTSSWGLCMCPCSCGFSCLIFGVGCKCVSRGASSWSVVQVAEYKNNGGFMSDIKGLLNLLNSRMNRMGVTKMGLYRQKFHARSKGGFLKFQMVGFLALALVLQACSTKPYERVVYRGLTGEGETVRFGERGTVDRRAYTVDEHERYMRALERERKLFELQRAMDREYDRNLQLSVEQFNSASQFFNSLKSQ